MTQPASAAPISVPGHSPPPSAHAGEVANGGKRGPLGRLARLRWLGLAVLGISCTVGGAFLSAKLRPGSPHTENEKASETGRAADDEPGDGAQPDCTRIDNQIREGRYESALALCREATPRPTGAALDALEFRAALCLEGLGERDQALTAFRTVAGRNAEGPLGVAASLGLARTLLLKRRPDEARPLLTTILLRSALPLYADQAVIADTSYLFAFALALDVSPGDRPTALKPLAIARARLDFPVETMLDWVQRPPPAAAKGTAPPHGLQVRRLGPRPDEFLVTAAVEQELFTAFVDRLAEQCGLCTQWTPEARAQAGTRTVTLAVEQMPLPTLARALFLDAELSGDIEDKALTIAAAGQLPERTDAAHRLAGARRAMQDALLAYPDHSLASAAFLELGNLEFASGRTKEGLGWYERLLRQAPRSRIPAELYYNLGVTRHQVGDRQQARDAFFWAVDRAPGGDLAQLAYVQIGRIYLEEADPGAAVRSLRRGLMLASAPETRATAGLMLAAAALLNDSPRSAYSALAEMGPAGNDEPFSRPAALLDALARYRLQRDPRKAGREAGDVLAALLNFREEPVLGQVGVLLAGRAYRDLGLGDAMAVLYDRSARDRTGPLVLEMTADLAEYHFQSGQWKPARREFEALLAGGGTHAEPVERRLAELDLIDRKPDDCLKRCRHLLQVNPKLANAGLLPLMGRAYALKGDNARAARCYAGEIPD